jgi:hypothetical protein
MESIYLIFKLYSWSLKSRASVVGRKSVNGLDEVSEFHSQYGQEFSSPHCQNRLWGPPSTVGYYPGSELAAAWNWPLTPTSV